jgi:hypothetical protein
MDVSPLSPNVVFDRLECVLQDPKSFGEDRFAFSPLTGGSKNRESFCRYRSARRKTVAENKKLNFRSFGRPLVFFAFN